MSSAHPAYTLHNPAPEGSPVSELEHQPPVEPAAQEPVADTHDATYVFIGQDGLRAGWGLLIYFSLIATFLFATFFVVAKIQHKPFPPHDTQTTTATTPSAHKAAEPQALTARTITLNDSLQFGVVLLAAFILSRLERRRFLVYGLDGPHPVSLFLKGLFTGLFGLSLLIGLLYATHVLVFDGVLLHGAAVLRAGLGWSIAFLAVALAEEYIFRGYLQYTLARGLAGLYGALVPSSRRRHTVGFWSAAFLLSLLFGLAHSSNAGETSLGLVSVVFAGLFFSLALYRTGNLWWAIGFHASWDWAQSFFYGVADSGILATGHLLATHPTGNPLLSGGTTGPEGSILLIPTLIIGWCIVLVTVPKTHRQGVGLFHPDTE